MTRRTAAIALLLAVSLVVVGGCTARQRSPQLILATTTSVSNSGLLDVMLPEYKRQTGVEVHTAQVGSGRALAMLAADQADIVISHAPETEAAMVPAHPSWHYRKIMYNDFVLVGPAADAAGLRGQRDAVAAMRRIVDTDALFLSRGDESGTHEREQSLWKLAGRAPKPGRLVVAGTGMGATLRVASEMGGYTLTDRAPFLQLANALQSVILFEGDVRLVNTYAVVFEPTAPSGAMAATFAKWLESKQGRVLIGGYRVKGSIQAAFHVWPEGVPSSDPRAEPFTVRP